MRSKARRRSLRIDDAVYNSEAFRTLPPSALKLWIDMRTQFNGSNNGTISAAMSLLVHRGWNSVDTLYRALHELLDRGLIACTRKGKAGPSRIASFFRFTDLACARNDDKFIEGKDAGQEYLTWTAKGSPEQKFRAPEIGAVLLRKSERYRSGNRSDHSPTAPEIGAQKNGEIAPNPASSFTKQASSALLPDRSENRSTYKLPGDGGQTAGSVVDLAPASELPAPPEPKKNRAAKPVDEFDRARQRYEHAAARQHRRKRTSTPAEKNGR